MRWVLAGLLACLVFCGEGCAEWQQVKTRLEHRRERQSCEPVVVQVYCGPVEKETK